MTRLDWRPALLANLRPQPDRDTALLRYARLTQDYEIATTRIREVRRRAIDRLAPQSGETVFDVGWGAGAMPPTDDLALSDREWLIAAGEAAAEKVLPALRAAFGRR